MPAPTQVKRKRLFRYLQAEALRLHENTNGGLDDTDANKIAINKADTLESRILCRADILACKTQLDKHLINWINASKFSVFLLWFFALISGIGVVVTALAHEQINLATALIAILGLHFVTFIIWLASYLPIVQPVTALSKLWLWLSKHISNNPNNSIAGQAFISLFTRTKSWKSLIGIISHSTWIAALSGAIVTLIILLSTRQYTFHWETTLLSPESFVALTKFIGFIPDLLGFTAPDQAAVTASLLGEQNSRQIQSTWSVWLIGSILIWGLLPRVLALLFCAYVFKKSTIRLSIDTNLKGWLELRDLLIPRHQIIGIDKPATKENIQKHKSILPTSINKNVAIIGHELDPEIVWPPISLPKGVIDLGTGSSRYDHKEVRKQISQHTDLYILLICNPNLTPDRGTIAWFDELRENAVDIKILCPEGTRKNIWDRVLDEHDFSQTTSLEDWLTTINNKKMGNK